MIYIDQPPPSGHKLIEHYKSVAKNGAVLSTVLQNHRYDISETFCESWSCPSLCWSTGGEEIYDVEGGRSIRIKPWGVISIAQQDRYAFSSKSDRPFRTNMICFPGWIGRSARNSEFEGCNSKNNSLQTRLLLPQSKTKSIAACVMKHAQTNDGGLESLQEKIMLLYASLLADQAAPGGAPNAIKENTRAELRRRVEKARQFILENYGLAELSLQSIASEACLSRYHLVRIFDELTGITPTQYLIAVRMEAALSLLQQTKLSVSSVARNVGYKSRVTFFKAFRKMFGVAPSAIERPGKAYF